MENIVEILGIFIVLSPIVFFTFFFRYVLKRLGESDINLADLLTEVVVPDPNATPPSSEKKKSASRLILFLSGLTSLILATVITSYYLYMNIYCINCQLNLELADFTNVLLALGIGVVPYAVNQVKKIKL